MELLLIVGVAVKHFVLFVAGLLVFDAAPGLVCLALVVGAVVASLRYFGEITGRVAALKWITSIVGEPKDEVDFSLRLEELKAKINEGPNVLNGHQVVAAWQEYSETFVPHDENDTVIIRNSVRPSTFFNVEDLGFGPGFWRIVPSLFVSIGLFLTFLGLISALSSMDLTSPEKVQSSLKALLTIASAKFIMSLTGLLCSIVFTVVLRVGLGKVELAVRRLCETLEEKLTFISLEALAVEQLRATKEQREHFRLIGTELVAELGRPLREELPAAISSSISAAMSPLLKQVGQIGADGMGEMVKDLSSRFSDDVGKALAESSNRLQEAGESIRKLAERMDQSSGRIGTEMDQVINRLSQSIEDLRQGMGSTAEVARGAFTQGADQMLAVMNQTLENIRDNTGEGAKAMSAAASDMRQAAESFKNELETASQNGSAAARDQMAAASAVASGAIGSAGQSVLDALGKTQADVLRAAETFAEKTTENLLAPLDKIANQFEGMVTGLIAGTDNIRRMSDGIRAGAEASENAAGSFRGASQDLVNAATPIRATTERLEISTRQLIDSTSQTSTTVIKSAETIALSAKDAFLAAEQILGSKAKAIDETLRHLQGLVDSMKGQGARLDDIDVKLGKAFDVYNTQVEGAVSGMRAHVVDMESKLAGALDTLQAIVDQAEQFAPESRRR